MNKKISSDRIRKLLSDKEIRVELINYYKWVVNLAVVILTLSISLVGLLGKELVYKPIIISGWVLLAVSVFLNWLTIKRLVSFPINARLIDEEKTWYNKLYESSLYLIQLYATIQNFFFLLGAFLVFFGFILNWVIK